MKTLPVLSLLVVLSPLAVAQTADGVGDLDSYGRVPVYLGAKQIPFATVRPSCTDAPVQALCSIFSSTSPMTRVLHADVIQFQIPARASHSQLCLEFTGTVSHSATNITATRRAHATQVRMVLRVHNPVLADATILDPRTGLPYPDQEIRMGQPILYRAASQATGDHYSDSEEITRRCGSSVINKQQLVQVFGLTRTQANAFFQQPTRISVDMHIDVQNVTVVSTVWRATLYGDR